MPKLRTTAIVVVICVFCLFLQFFGIKFIFAGFYPAESFEERPPLEAVKLLFHTCESSGLFVFAVEPSLLRALRVGTQRRLELWGQDRHDSVAVGVKDAGLDQMHLVMSAMRRAGYQNWVKVDADPRGLSVASQTSQRSVTTHFLLWVPVADRRPMVIHMVVFYKRGDHYWHSALSDPSRPPPFDMKGSSFHHAAGIYDLFELGTVTVDGVEIRYPNDTFAFLKEKESSEFIECDYKRAYLFNQQFPPDPSDRAKTFRRKSRQLLALTKKVLEALEIPFWLSSGTCLGWYRQCDLIPHTTDVDIGIFVKDFREEMVAAMETAGLVLTHRFGRESDSLELSFLYGDIKLDVFFFYETRDYSWNGGTQASTGAKFKYIFPPFHLCWTEFLDLWLRVPCPSFPYVHANYGPGWGAPNKAWDWKSSPHNVIANGKWPEGEWDEVVQLYD